MRRPSITLVRDRDRTLYAGTSYNITCFYTMDTSAVDTEVQANILVVVQPISKNVTSGNLQQLNGTTFSKNITFIVLTNKTRVIPVVIATLSPATSSSDYICGSYTTLLSQERLSVERKCYTKLPHN